MHRTSVAMTAATEEALIRRLVRCDGQEDICLATYRPSTGLTRFSALIRTVVPPESGDRLVHGNATVTADYILRVAEAAQEDDCGMVLLHSHPGASQWQPMSGPDRDCEASYANLVREITGLPLVGMTLATRNRTWSARHWDIGVGERSTALTARTSGSLATSSRCLGTTQSNHLYSPAAVRPGP